MSLDPSENPYAPNAVPGSQTPFGAEAPASEELQRSILTNIRIVAIMLIVHGSMLLLAALFFIAMSAFLPNLIAKTPPPANASPNGPTPEQMATILTGTYLFMGTAALLPGILQLVAGIRNLYPKGRTLGLVALFSGVVSIATCYCAPTSIGLLIYGLIIYFNPTAIRAFELGKQGITLTDMLNNRIPRS